MTTEEILAHDRRRALWLRLPDCAEARGTWVLLHDDQPSEVLDMGMARIITLNQEQHWSSYKNWYLKPDAFGVHQSDLYTEEQPC